ncbi:MAG: hypothetical protein U9Q96_01870 [Patescibacteria group bacterium]|nr:hypothetical protein [Patescibacteria group bacterium]
MNKIFKSSLVIVLTFLVMFSSAGGASAAITIAALTVTSNGALTLATTGNFAVTPGAAANTIFIGKTDGTGLITLGDSSATQTVDIGAGEGATTIAIGTGATSANTINIGTAAVANVVNIGTGGAAVDVEIGDVLGAVDVFGVNSILAGTGDALTITANAASTWSTTDGGLTISNTGTADADDITILTTTEGDIVLTGGDDISITSADDLLLATTDGSFTVTPGTAGNAIFIGKTDGTGLITLGDSSATQTVDIGAGEGATTIAIGTGATSANTINIGSGDVANTIVIGDTTTAAVGTIEMNGATATVNAAFNYAADAGSDDTYVITPSPAFTAYVAGMMIVFTVNTANTDAATINVNGLGAKALEKGNDAALATNDLIVNRTYIAVYDGTQFDVINPTTQ